MELQYYGKITCNFFQKVLAKNTLNLYPTTKGSLPHILTGIGYDNSSPFEEYIEEAYRQTNLYDAMVSGGYDIGVYTNEIFMSSLSKELFLNIEEQEKTPTSYTDLGFMLYKSTAFCYFPHLLKPYMWYYTGDFDKYIDTSNNGGLYSPYNSDDVLFYNALRSNQLSINNDTYAFRIYHLNGVHPPYTMTENITHNSNGTTEIEEAVGSLNVVLEYIEQLKKANIYDNSNIIIMSDHGVIDMRQNSMLMVKTRNRDSDFSISSAPISYEDIHNTLLYLVTGDNKYLPNIFSWSEEDERLRRFMHYDHRDSWDKAYLPDMYEYVTNSAAGKVQEMRKTGKVFTASGVIEDYKVMVKLGEKLNFGNNHKIESAFLYGLSDSGGDHTWSLGKKAKLSVILEDNISKDDHLAISLRFKYIYGDSQRIKCYINGTFIEEKVVRSVGKPIIFLFPPELLVDSDKLEIEFEYPDAFKNEKTSEIRVLAFAFEQMVIDYAKNIINYLEVGNRKVTIDFSESGNSDLLIGDGWHGQEKNHRWSSEKADIVFNTKIKQDYVIAVDCLTFTHSGETHVLLNGVEITLWEKNPKRHIENIVLSKELLNENGIQKVTFITDDAKSPLETGVGDDSRILGINVTEITIMPYSQ